MLSNPRSSVQLLGGGQPLLDKGGCTWTADAASSGRAGPHQRRGRHMHTPLCRTRRPPRPLPCLGLVCPQVEDFTEAVRRHYWYEFFADELPIWGFVGPPPEQTKGDSNVYIYTHKTFDIAYNGDRVGDGRGGVLAGGNAATQPAAGQRSSSRNRTTLQTLHSQACRCHAAGLPRFSLQQQQQPAAAVSVRCAAASSATGANQHPCLLPPSRVDPRPVPRPTPSPLLCHRSFTST